MQESPRRGGEPRETTNPVSLREDDAGATVESMSQLQSNYVRGSYGKVRGDLISILNSTFLIGVQLES